MQENEILFIYLFKDLFICVSFISSSSPHQERAPRKKLITKLSSHLQLPNVIGFRLLFTFPCVLEFESDPPQTHTWL